MINQNNLMVITQTFTKAYNSKFVQRLRKAGYNDANPYNELHVLSVDLFQLKNVMVSVQTKVPTYYVGDYHVWIRPLSKETYLGTNSGFKHVDEVYMIINGGTDWYVPSPLIDIDATNTWM